MKSLASCLLKNPNTEQSLSLAATATAVLA
jgi:hypothetical protein